MDQKSTVHPGNLIRRLYVWNFIIVAEIYVGNRMLWMCCDVMMWCCKTPGIAWTQTHWQQTSPAGVYIYFASRESSKCLRSCGYFGVLFCAFWMIQMMINVMLEGRPLLQFKERVHGISMLCSEHLVFSSLTFLSKFSCQSRRLDVISFLQLHTLKLDSALAACCV